jgi:parvulin-like peptidyl-prolyl isomerase
MSVRMSFADEKPMGVNRPVAEVNGVPITARMLNLAMEERLPATGHRTLSDKRLLEIQREELEKLLVRELIVQEARRRNITADKTAVDSEMEKLRARFPSEQKFKETIGRRGMTTADLRAGVEEFILIRKVTDQEVYSKISFTDPELKKYYDENRNKFRTPDQIRLRTILIAVDPSSRKEDWDKAREKADGVAERAKKGEDFTALVAEFSDDQATKSKGGDSGLLHRGRLNYSELEQVAFSVDVGKVGDPVRTLYGFVIYKVEEKRPARQLDYDEINKKLLISELRRSTAEKRLQEWIGGLRAKADIKFY